MAYPIDDRDKDREKWRVYIKSENFIGNRMDDKYGVEIGITEPEIFPEAVQAKNILKNVKITLSINDKNSNLHKKTSVIEGNHITINMVGKDSNKVLVASGYFDHFIISGKTLFEIKYEIQGKIQKIIVPLFEDI